MNINCQISIIILLLGCLLTNCAGQKKHSSPLPPGEINSETKEAHSTNLNDTTIRDIDGNVYPVVVIGNKLWMATNLKVSNYNNGTPILQFSGGGFSRPEGKGMFTIYDNDVINEVKYGSLYNFYAVAEGCLCPKGWHVPSEQEWQEMIDSGGDELLDFKPGGSMNPQELSPFFDMGTTGYWWTSTSVGRNTVAYFSFQTETQGLKQGGANEGGFFSVRCVRN